MMLSSYVLNLLFSFTFAGVGTYAGTRLANRRREKAQSEKAYALDELWEHAYNAAGNELADMLPKLTFRLGKSTTADGQRGMRWNIWVEGVLLGSVIVSHVKVCSHGLLTPTHWTAIKPDGTAEEQCLGLGQAMVKLLEVSPWKECATS